MAAFLHRLSGKSGVPPVVNADGSTEFGASHGIGAAAEYSFRYVLAATPEGVPVYAHLTGRPTVVTPNSP